MSSCLDVYDIHTFTDLLTKVNLGKMRNYMVFFGQSAFQILKYTQEEGYMFHISGLQGLLGSNTQCQSSENWVPFYLVTVLTIEALLSLAKTSVSQYFYKNL